MKKNKQRESVKVLLYLDKDGNKTKNTKIFEMPKARFDEYSKTLRNMVELTGDLDDVAKEGLIQVILSRPQRVGGGDSSPILDVIREELSGQTFSVPFTHPDSGKEVQLDVTFQRHKANLLLKVGDKYLDELISLYPRGKGDKTFDSKVTGIVKPEDMVPIEKLLRQAR